MLRPSFSLQSDSLQSSTDNAVGGPDAFFVQRSMAAGADSLMFTLHDPVDLATGETVTLELGHDDENNLVFTGTVVAVGTTITGLRVQALGKAQGLLSLRAGGTYENQSVGAILRDLASQADVSTGTVDDGPLLPSFYVTKHRSAYYQLYELAQALGFEMFTTTDGNLQFRALGSAANLDSGAGALAGAVATVGALAGGGEVYRYGEHVLNIRHHKSEPVWQQVHVGGESPTSTLGDSTAHWLTANESDYTGDAGSGDRSRSFVDAWARSQDLTDRLAEGRLISLNRSANQINAEVMGRPTLELGDDVSTDAFTNSNLNQSGYIHRLEHRFASNRGFFTHWSATIGAES
jgi:hypothetical protein